MGWLITCIRLTTFTCLYNTECTVMAGIAQWLHFTQTHTCSEVPGLQDRTDPRGTSLDPYCHTGSCLAIVQPFCDSMVRYLHPSLEPILAWPSAPARGSLRVQGIGRGAESKLWLLIYGYYILIWIDIWRFLKVKIPQNLWVSKEWFFWMIWGSPVLWHPTCWLMLVLQESPDYRLSKKQTSADSLLFEQAQLVNSPPIWVLQRAFVVSDFVDIRWYKCPIQHWFVHFQSRQLPDVFVWLDQARFSHLSGSLQSKKKVKKKPPLGGRWVILSNFTLCFCSPDFLWKIAQLKVIDDLWRWFTYSRLPIFQCAKHESLPKGTPTAPERGRWTWRWLEPEDEGPIWGAKSGA